MTRLGMIYHNALGVPRDAALAASWWKRAALLGDPDGQAMLGAAYFLGAGVQPDPVQSYAWLLRARRLGSALAEPFMTPARERLSKEKLAEAERIADAPLMESAS
jgi:TPR repeat protein